MNHEHAILELATDHHIEAVTTPSGSRIYLDDNRIVAQAPAGQVARYGAETVDLEAVLWLAKPNHRVSTKRKDITS